MNRTYCLSYVSRDLTAGDEAQIADILQRSQRNNERISVCGFLAQVNGFFFQVLEGSQVSVEALYEEISRDPRHDSVRRVLEVQREAPRFRTWEMMYIRGWPRLFRTLAGPWSSHLEGVSIDDPCWDSPDFAERMIEAAALVHDFSVERQREILVDILPLTAEGRRTPP